MLRPAQTVLDYDEIEDEDLDIIVINTRSTSEQTAEKPLVSKTDFNVLHSSSSAPLDTTWASTHHFSTTMPDSREIIELYAWNVIIGMVRTYM